MFLNTIGLLVLDITILQLLQDVCDVLGFEFHVKLNAGAVISVGLIDLTVPPSSFRNIIDSFDGIATKTYPMEKN
jgi:hypothetical protein